MDRQNFPYFHLVHSESMSNFFSEHSQQKEVIVLNTLKCLEWYFIIAHHIVWSFLSYFLRTTHCKSVMYQYFVVFLKRYVHIPHRLNSKNNICFVRGRLFSIIFITFAFFKLEPSIASNWANKLHERIINVFSSLVDMPEKHLQQSRNITAVSCCCFIVKNRSKNYIDILLGLCRLPMQRSHCFAIVARKWLVIRLFMSKWKETDFVEISEA